MIIQRVKAVNIVLYNQCNYRFFSSDFVDKFLFYSVKILLIAVVVVAIIMITQVKT